VLVTFVSSFIPDKHKESLPAILSETIHIYYNYIKGMVFLYIIVGVLNSIGLLLLGVDYAILFGMVTALMTIIPYIGIMISAILPMTIIWAETNNVWYPVGVALVFAFVQYLEANIIFPYVVGKQLGINTLVSIIAILLGGAIWGVSGMILFLPFLALFKLVSGKVKELQPFYHLLEIPK
jgi:predicted PurR-regulated permease PerM